VPLCAQCHGKVHERSFLHLKSLTKRGLALARARGVRGGRPHVMTRDVLYRCIEMYAQDQISLRTLAQRADISPQTLCDYLCPDGSLTVQGAALLGATLMESVAFRRLQQRIAVRHAHKRKAQAQERLTRVRTRRQRRHAKIQRERTTPDHQATTLLTKRRQTLLRMMQTPMEPSLSLLEVAPRCGFHVLELAHTVDAQGARHPTGYVMLEAST
jgi:AraC-like DNA-binding protein